MPIHFNSTEIASVPAPRESKSVPAPDACGLSLWQCSFNLAIRLFDLEGPAEEAPEKNRERLIRCARTAREVVRECRCGSAEPTGETAEGPLRVRFQRLAPEAALPRKAHPSDAAFDLTATSRHFDEEGNVVYGFGLALEIPEGYVGHIWPRSSISRKDLYLTNSVGTIDAGYRGEITAKFKPSLLYVDLPPLRTSAQGSYEPKGGSVQTDVKTQAVSFYGADDTLFAYGHRYRDYEPFSEACDEYVRGRHPLSLNPRLYEVGDRVAQLTIDRVEAVVFEEADDLSKTERGAGGYGSTGN